MQLEDYLQRDDRIILPTGSTEQHAYLSLGTDNILAERVSIEGTSATKAMGFWTVSFGLSIYLGSGRAGDR